MTTLIGSDPEAFLVDVDGTFVISVGKIGGSKDEPRPVTKGAVQEDNVLAEFNIDPASTAEEFINHIDTVVAELEAIVQPLKLLFTSSHEFETEELDAGGEQALMFGCDPDFNCWTKGVNDGPDGFATNLRTAGGHVHIGYDYPDAGTSWQVARACDYVLGLPSVLLDGDARRRELYGSAGACRLKPYGVEYRVLSNFWLSSDVFKRWVFSTAQASVHAVSKLDEWATIVSPDEVVRIINTGDVEAAANAVAALDLTMPGV